MAVRTTVTDGLLVIADWRTRACSCFDHRPLNSILPNERVIYNGITHRKEGRKDGRKEGRREREAGNNITNDQSYKLQSAPPPEHLKMVLSGVITW